MLMRLAALMAVVVLWPMSLLAQPLADRVPADAIVYVGWQGTEAMPPAYGQSRTKALIDASNLPRLISDFLPSLLEKIAREKPSVAQKLTMTRAISGIVARHPSAIYLTGIDFKTSPPTPRAALLCLAGKEADVLMREFTRLATMAKASRDITFPVRAFRQGDLVGIAVGYEQETRAFAGGEAAQPKPLNASDGFKQAMAQVQKDPVAAVYVDNEALRRLIDQAIKLSPDPNVPVLWPKVRDALGLSGVQRMALTGGFEGRDWMTQAFIAIPAPRTGLMALLDSKPVSDELLRTVPGTATAMGVCRLDLARLVTEIRTAAGKIDPEAQKLVDRGLGGAQVAMAMDVQKGLLEPLGEEWAVYNDPTMAGSGPLGMVLVNRLRQPAAARKGLARFELFLDNTINGQLRRQRMRVSFEQTKVGNLTIHYVALPLVSPSWAIQGDMLFVAMYPQLIVAAAEAAAAKGSSILDNPDFQALRQRLDAPNASSITFMDLPKTIGDIYQLKLATSQFVLGTADMFGVKMPPMLLPPLSRIRQHLAPAGGAAWTDDAGWHMKSISPFPLSEPMAAQATVLVGLPVAVAAALPWAIFESQRPPAAMMNIGEAEAAVQITFIDPELAQNIATAPPTLEQREGKLAVAVPVRSTDERDQRVTYTIVFLNKQGNVIEQQSVQKPLVLVRNRPATIEATSSSPDAVDFRLEMRRAR